jgi:hypothetical protein
MVRYPIIFILIPLFILSCCTHKSNNSYVNCYQEKVRWGYEKNKYKDSVVNFRNISGNVDFKRVICYCDTTNRNLEKLVWESKYISGLVNYLDKKDWAFVFSFKFNTNNEIIASFYFYNRTNKEIVEMERFKIQDYKIVGINIFPEFDKEFIPVEKFDKEKAGVKM